MRLMLGTDFPYPAVGLVHLQNRIRQHVRLNLGDRLTLTARPGRFLSHDRGQAFTLETTVTRDGATVWEGVSVYLHLGRPSRGDPAPVLTGEAADRLVETWTLPTDLGRRYARVSGDANPIHTSAVGARLFGFRRAIAHGMWTKARAVAALSPPVPLDAAEVEVAFRAPLFLPGKAGLYAGPTGPSRDFEVRDATGARAHLRGRLTLSPEDSLAC
ncbi:MaoC like domain protein [compost metagenome]